MDRGDAYTVDSYFFAYFHDLSAALEQIRDAVRASRNIGPSSSQAPVIDTTVSRSPSVPSTAIADKTPIVTSPDALRPKSPSYTSRLTSFLRPLQESLPLSRTISAPEPPYPEPDAEDFTHVSKRSNTSFVPITTSPEHSIVMDSQGPRAGRPHLDSHASSASATPTASTYLSNHSYPPSSWSSPPTLQTVSHSRENSNASSWSVGVPSWLKMPSRRSLIGNPFSSLTSRATIDSSTSIPSSSGSSKVSEVLSTSIYPLSNSGSGDYGFFSILEGPEAAIEPEIDEKFHNQLAFDEKETLLGCKCFSIFPLARINHVSRPQISPVTCSAYCLFMDVFTFLQITSVSVLLVL